MDIVKIAILGITGVLLGLQFRSQKPEYSLYIGICVSLVIFFYVLEYLSQVQLQLAGVREFLSYNQKYFSILFKVIGITYVCEFSAGICRDAGFGAIAGQIEMFGKVSVLLAGMPVLLAVIDTIRMFV